MAKSRPKKEKDKHRNKPDAVAAGLPAQQNSERDRDEVLLLRFIAVGFIATFGFFALSLFFPPDMSKEVPIYHRSTLALSTLNSSALIFASTAMGIRLGEHRNILAATGFTMLSIANALFIVTFFELRHFTLEEFQKTYDIHAGAMTLAIPGCLLLGFYNEFRPRWLRFAPAVYSATEAMALGSYYAGNRNYARLDGISFVGWSLLNVVVLVWGIQLWRLASRNKASALGIT